jgi:hypothetical protein
MRPLIYTQDINVVAGNIPAALANPPLIAALQQGGRALVPFAGVPGQADCHGVTVSGMANQYGGVNKAAVALGFSSVSSLQSTITTFCGN